VRLPDSPQCIKDEANVGLSSSRLSESNLRLRDEIETERRRIAHALHDETGQDLTAVLLHLGRLKQRFRDDSSVTSIIDPMHNALSSAITSMRRIINDLRPLALDDLGFVAAARELIQNVEKASGVAIDLMIEGEPSLLTAAEQTNLYRTLQEALSNVVRHANATEIHVTFVCLDWTARLEVRDNGNGFDAMALNRRTSYGLLGMQERAQLLGGQFEMRSQPGEGSRICFAFPMLRNSEESAQ
jgi:two-component system, NarL family, sensor histidine kinase UhpB